MSILEARTGECSALRADPCLLDYKGASLFAARIGYFKNAPFYKLR